MEPQVSAEYLGKGRWNVVKTCPINGQLDGCWYYDEQTGDLEWNNDYYKNKASQ
jgi:hypothetical protein